MYSVGLAASAGPTWLPSFLNPQRREGYPRPPFKFSAMDQVVLLCRVSTASQDYERQVSELTDFCQRADWQVMRVFANKVSGKLPVEQRPELLEMLDYVRSNQIKRVVVLEISRLGRNTLEALKVIKMLNEAGVSLYIKNYNLETLDQYGKVSPTVSLICTILLEISQMNRLTLIERMSSGRDQYIKKCRETGKKMGRPSTYKKPIDDYRKQYAKEIALLKKMSLKNVSAITGTSINTLRKIKALFID